MLFNSLEFAIFLPIVFFLYWFVLQKSTKLQNVFLLAASYIFYGWWDWRFLSLIVASSLVDYVVGLLVHRSTAKGKRTALLCVSIFVNLGLLGFFKYYNFFMDSLVAALDSVGIPISVRALDIVLPVGISFYTFQTLSYTIDIYRRRIEPTWDATSFFAFVAFFPQLVAGPIERAANLLPQFQRPRRFDAESAADGMRQMLYGLFKKIVIADGCGFVVDSVFSNPDGFNGSSQLLAIVFFAFQIYADFSGYSDIAIGVARLLGFRLMRNFAFPYFSRDIAEFWRRWHISLSTWFRDYVFIPLGGSRGGKWFTTRNILITFIVSGLWHGANWTFVVWGLLNAIYYLPVMLREKQKEHREIIARDRVLPPVRELAEVAITFGLTLIAWVFFRADSLESAFTYLMQMFSVDLLSVPSIGRGQLGWVVAFVGFEWLQRGREHALQVDHLPTGVRWAIYWVIAYCTISFFSGENSFIYFQF